MPEPHLRASDSDRSAVAMALGEHMAAGRLTLAEYEERLTRVYETKTLGGLATLTADLPQPTAVRTPSPAPARPAAPMWAHGCGAHAWGSGDQSAWRSWLTTALIVLSVWLVTALFFGAQYFWPMWVIGPWGAVLLVQTLTGGHDARPGPDTGERQRARA